MRTLDEDVAMEIGEKPALMLNQILYWISRKQGTPDGYIWNTYEGWRSQENFPWWGKNTVRRVLKKLEDLEIVFKRKHSASNGVHSWDQRREWGLNYSHPLVVLVLSKKSGAGAQNGHPQVPKKIRSYNTDTYPKKTANTTTHVVPTRLPASRDPYHNRTRSNGELKEHKVSPRSKPSRWDPKDWPEVEEWLASKSQDFRKQVWEHAEYNLLRPKKTKVEYPEAYKKGIVWKSWRDDTKGTSESDFKFVDKTGLKPAPVVRSIPIPYYKKVKADISFDDEMEMLYEQGGIYDV